MRHWRRLLVGENDGLLADGLVAGGLVADGLVAGGLIVVDGLLAGGCFPAVRRSELRSSPDRDFQSGSHVGHTLV